MAADIILTAMDSDVIKQYVALGLGVGIDTASMAFDRGLLTKELRAVRRRTCSPRMRRLAVRRGAYLR